MMRPSLLLFTSILFFLSALVLGASDSEPSLRIEVQHYVQDCETKTKDGDNIAVHYRGSLAADGSEFDTSYSRGRPMRFVLGAGRVIKGWDQGLLDMCIGEKRKLTIPPELGYGQRAMGPIPAGSTLIFETELMGIGKDEL